VPAIMFRPSIAALAAAVLVATGTWSFAATVSFRAELSGAREVPPTQSKGTGSLKATLDTASNSLTWTGFYSGLSGPVTGAHFQGPVSYVGLTSEQNAPIQVGTSGSLASPFKGSTTITRRPGQGPHGRTLVFQYSYSSQQRRRDPRTDRQILILAATQANSAARIVWSIFM
jgi:hypothetical protein